MKNSILVLGLTASAGFGFLDAGSASASAIWESRPDFNYTGTDEDGEQEEVKTGRGRK
jgi:hypothetical protein